MAPPQQNSRSPRRGPLQDGVGPGSDKRSPQRSASFHGRASAAPSHPEMRRPTTLPDLLASPGGRRMTVSSPLPPPADLFRLCSGGGADQQQKGRKVPAKVLVNVSVQRSIGALQVMASTDWTVDQLVASSIKQYLKEGRRPPLPTSDPSAFGLHYSQFCLDCLNPTEKLIGLGSRNFFLCPKQNAAAVLSASSALSPSDSPAPAGSVALPGSSQSLASCSREADTTSKISIHWLRFMDFLL